MFKEHEYNIVVLYVDIMQTDGLSSYKKNPVLISVGYCHQLSWYFTKFPGGADLRERQRADIQMIRS